MLYSVRRPFLNLFALDGTCVLQTLWRDCAG
jgi:hypothetical protein